MINPESAPELFVVTSMRTQSVEMNEAVELLSLPDTDAQGRVLFRAPVSPGKFTETLRNYIQITQDALVAISEEASAYAIDEVTLKLGVDASVGCIFVGESKVEASIEVKLKRKTRMG